MDRIRKWMQQIPIPAAFVLCGMAALLCALSLTRATMWFAQKNKGEIAASYAEAATPSMEAIPEQEQQPDLVMLEPEPGPSREALPKEEASVRNGQPEQEQEVRLYRMPANIPITLPEEEKKKYNFYENLDNMAAIFWYSLCLCLASLVFYLWKIKKPLQVLNQAVGKIAENDLNFEIDYQGPDELGRLCQAFESMRRELAQNNKKMWNSMEERKRLNAAFAHDLRTPLTVLQGHADILFDALSGREQDADAEFLSDLSAISNQVTRMNSYLDTMSALRRLEDYDPCLRAVRAAALEELLEDTAASLFPGEKTACVPPGIRTVVSFEMESQELWLDREAFSQIYENLLSNAARYARERIDVRLYEEQDFLVLEVADDGAGFTQKDLQSAFAPYYRGDRSKPASSAHFGLGLYICSLLAGKLGGKVQLANGENGGAKVMVKLYAQACKRVMP